VNHFVWGFAGGLSVNFLRLGAFAGKRKAERDVFLRDPIYWIQFFGVPVIGGLVAQAYGDVTCPLPGILPFHIGASAPALIKLIAGPLNAPERKASKAVDDLDDVED
jgi:hypothetical protein